jgi:hypothetical protein
VRGRVESLTGYDLSPATVHHDSSTAARAGVHGLASGRDIHLAPGVSPNTAHGAHVLAHEFAHVVQQATGAAAGLSSRSGRRHALEADADHLASRTRGATASPRSLAALPAAPQPAVQCYDPRYHRTSLVDGLKGSGFSADEIGKIYAANWERDLSQAHPDLGNVILAWKSLKIAAYEQHIKSDDVTHFQDACQTLLEHVVVALATKGGFERFKNATSAADGYTFYEHMDNPKGTPEGFAVRLAVLPKNDSNLPAHVYASREYIKQCLFGAAEMAHPGLRGGASAAVAADSADTRAKILLEVGHQDPTPGLASTAPVARETSLQVQEEQKLTSGGGVKLPERAYDLIGRASHALEDFWSHSNFVETALHMTEFEGRGLTTSTFLEDDKSHALAHKIRGMADEIAEEMPLADSLAHRTFNDPKRSEVDVGSRTPVAHDNLAVDLAKGYVDHATSVLTLPLTVASGFGHGFVRGYENRQKEGGGVATSLGVGVLSAYEGAVVGPIVSWVGSRAGVALLRQASEHIDNKYQRKQEADRDFGGHGLLAKDQPGHDDDAYGALKTARFNLSHALSVGADRLIIGKLKSVLDAPDAGVAEARLQEIFKLLDQLLTPPSPQHPLWDILESHRAAAEVAVNAYLASQRPKAPFVAPPVAPGKF